MMVLIIGGSGSGKSAYAEEYIGRLSGKSNKYYLATMQVFDEEGKKKVARHQRLQKNKGFLPDLHTSHTLLCFLHRYRKGIAKDRGREQRLIRVYLKSDCQ